MSRELAEIILPDTHPLFLRQKKENRLLFAIPGYKVAPFEFVNQLLVHGLPAEDFLTCDGVVYYHAQNKMAAQALLHPDWDYIVFLEIDHKFPLGFLDRIKTYTQPVVGGAYFSRHAPYVPCWGGLDDDGVNRKLLSDDEYLRQLDSPGLHRTEIVPMGCTAIRRDVLANWPDDKQPWFMHPSFVQRNKEGKLHPWEMSSDIWFAHRLKEQGVEVYVDTWFQAEERQPKLGHLSEMSIDAGTFRRMAEGRKAAMVAA